MAVLWIKLTIMGMIISTSLKTRDGKRNVLKFYKEMSLHVHHLSYEKGKDVWGYELSNFVTLCESCHELETEIRNGLEKDLLKIMKTTGIMVRHLEGLIDDLSKLDVEHSRGLSMDFIFTAIGFILRPEGYDKVIEIRDELIEKHRKKDRKAWNKEPPDMPVDVNPD